MAASVHQGLSSSSLFEIEIDSVTIFQPCRVSIVLLVETDVSLGIKVLLRLPHLAAAMIDYGSWALLRPGYIVYLSRVDIGFLQIVFGLRLGPDHELYGLPYFLIVQNASAYLFIVGHSLDKIVEVFIFLDDALIDVKLKIFIEPFIGFLALVH